jgi:diguanylate cyclase (GGDEF)-like protein
LTGLSNRRAFFEMGTALIHQAHRQEFVISAIMIDIDYFKKINDTYGHAGGDAILQHLASLLIGSLRSSDICCRLGGEEFAVLLPGSDLENAMRIAEKIRQLLETSPTFFAGKKMEMTVSLGVACGPKDMEGILRAADMALYRAKKTGRNRVAD